jgi:N-acetylmuramoyl-L-alanine amidase
MDKTLLKQAAIQSVALMLAVVTLSYAIHQYKTITTAASNKIETTDLSNGKVGSVDNLDTTKQQSDSIDESLIHSQDTDHQTFDIDSILRNTEEGILNNLSDSYIIIQKPQEGIISYQLDDLYRKSSIRFVLQGLSKIPMDSNRIGRVREEKLITGEPQYMEIKTYETDSKGKEKEIITKDFGNDLIHGITITYSFDNAMKQHQSELLIELDSVYVPTVYESNSYYFIDLKKPKDVYDKVLVIDAGHGGKDAGALSRNEKYYEKNLNLQILLELKKLLDTENIKVYYTRIEDDTVFLRPRVNLANAVNCDFFISIHCNASVSNSPNGTEVIYYNTEYNAVKAMDLALILAEEIGKSIPLKQRGLIEEDGDDIFILENAMVPAALIEVGYVTNNNDMNFLSQEANKKAVAQGIYNGIIKAYNELITHEDTN